MKRLAFFMVLTLAACAMPKYGDPDFMEKCVNRETGWPTGLSFDDAIKACSCAPAVALLDGDFGHLTFDKCGEVTAP